MGECQRSILTSSRPLRRLRAAFGPIEVKRVIGHGVDQNQARLSAAEGELTLEEAPAVSDGGEDQPSPEP